MTETTTRPRAGRRIAALSGAIGLVLVGTLMAGPAVAASAAEPVAAVPISEEIVPISDNVASEIPYIQPEAVPITEVLQPAEPISLPYYDALTRPLGLSIFLGSALTLGAGGIAFARLAAHRKQQAVRADSEK